MYVYYVFERVLFETPIPARLCWRRTARSFDLFIDGNHNNNNNITSGQNTHTQTFVYYIIFPNALSTRINLCIILLLLYLKRILKRKKTKKKKKLYVCIAMYYIIFILLFYKIHTHTHTRTNRLRVIVTTHQRRQYHLYGSNKKIIIINK